MIFDKIENSVIYENISPLIKRAFDYLRQTDFSGMEKGQYNIDGDEIYAILQEYDTKNDADAKLEAHRNYIDVQYIISGEELIGVHPLTNQTPYKEYDAENDFALYDDACSYIKVNPGQFAILFPQDLHKPGIKVGGSTKIKKALIKVRVL